MERAGKAHAPSRKRARQVGKTYIIEKFGKEYFEHFAILNFEQYPEYKGCFESLDPLKIINAILSIPFYLIEELPRLVQLATF